MRFQIFLLCTTVHAYLCFDTNKIFENINQRVLKFNKNSAEIAWESSIFPDNTELPEKSAKYQKERLIWEQQACKELETLYNHHLLNSSQARQTYLLCRGPKYNFREARIVSNLYEELQLIYTEAEICIPTSEIIDINNLNQVESAILKYLRTVKNLNSAHNHRMAGFANLTDKIDNVKTGNSFCLKGEDDFEKVMEFSRNEEVLRWIWELWRDKVGPTMKEPYRRLVEVENIAARRNGYENIGATWRDELEIPHLRQVCRQLHKDMQPLYTVLHGVTRFYLRRFYGDVVPRTGPIPAHLLGNLWSQNWEPLVNLIAPKSIDLDQSIKNNNWTVLDMVRKADDFYQSLGLPAMTEIFWRESVFTRKNRVMRCHGTAADMFKDGDFRLLYCSDTTMQDFYVLHHEMGHITYYAAYKNQPALFRQANAALHETIGDAIMYGVMTPLHLHRLKLINDSILYIYDKNTTTNAPKYNIDDDVYLKLENVDKNNRENGKKKVDIHYERKNDINSNHQKDNENHEKNFENGLFNTDDIFMLRQALNKLPQIPFSLLIDEYRWKYFEGIIPHGDLNKEFWKMAEELQGISPPRKRGEEYFDIGAKFHVPDNTPYIRYFLSSFLQHQLFETLCKAAVFGYKTDEKLPETIALNRCDIYGSRTAGKILRDLMSFGHSKHWRELVQQMTGDNDISSAALLRYYRPLYLKLLKLVRRYNIPIGWDTEQ